MTSSALKNQKPKRTPPKGGANPGFADHAAREGLTFDYATEVWTDHKGRTFDLDGVELKPSNGPLTAVGIVFASDKGAPSHRLRVRLTSGPHAHGSGFVLYEQAAALVGDWVEVSYYPDDQFARVLGPKPPSAAHEFADTSFNPDQRAALAELFALLDEGTPTDGILCIAPAGRVAKLVKAVRS